MTGASPTGWPAAPRAGAACGEGVHPRSRAGLDRDVSLGVRAGFRLALEPRRVRNGQRIRFLGRLKGGPARKGARVTIDVLVPDARRRVPIGNVKADGRGHSASRTASVARS